MRILVKVSGDLVEDEKFYRWLKSIYSPLDNLFVLCGGGTKITNILTANNIPFSFGPFGREIKEERGKRLAKTVLEEQKIILEKKLREKVIRVDKIFLPFAEEGKDIYHLNADIFAEALSVNFDKVYFLTLEGRTKSISESSNKIEVVNL